MRSIAGASLALFLSAGCSTNEPTAPSLINICNAPRPQVCTMEYSPVCAASLSGGAKDYSSGCNACADDAVASFVPGICPDDTYKGEAQ
ncbi:MAG: hypothetical protein ACI9DH_000643 [Halioglobus sp.]|jgi:hypothetical protein